jgi:hypothetical protein
VETITQNASKGNSARPREIWPEHREALHARGLLDDAIEAAGLWSAKESQVADILGFNPSRSGGIVIPHRDPKSGHELIYRVRLDHPVKVNGKEIRYLGAKGVPNHLFFPPGWGALLQSECPVIFTEGEFKALVAQHAGLPTLSAAGVWSWRTKNHLGQSVPLSDFDLIQWPDREIVLALDNDISDKESVQKAQTALAHELYRRGVGRVSALSLPYVEGAKLGIDDYINLFGIDALQQLDTYEIPCPYPPVKVWSVTELLQADMPRPAPLIQGWGMRQGAKVILTGIGGRGKTTLLTQLSCHLGAGKPVFGYGPLAISEPQRVALYFAEDPPSEVRFRISNQIEELGYGTEVSDRVFLLDFSGRRISIENEEDRTILFRALRQCQADVAILDPLVSIHDSDENSNAAMRKLLDILSPLAAEGRSFILAHHEPKNVDNSNGAARGASAIRDWARTMLRLTAHGDASGTSTRYTIALDKANYGGAVWSLTLERQKDSYIFSVAQEKSAVTPVQIWEVVGPEERWFADVVKELVGRFTVSEATTTRAIKRAEELSLVIVGEKPNPDTGRDKKTIARGEGKVADEG